MGDPALAIASPPPTFDTSAVEQLLSNDYGLSGSLTPLVSERDQNFRVDAPGGQRFVVKIANVAEAGVVTDFQIQALLHLEERECRVRVPRIVRTRGGDAATTIDSGAVRHIVRLVTWVPGVPLVGRAPEAGLAFALGQTLAHLDAALRDFQHRGDQQDLLWDMQRAAELRDKLSYIPEHGERALVESVLDDFEERVAPSFSDLRRQVIHNDLNPGNVLVTDTARPAVAGVIDFGDMVRAPLVVDVAIAASYLRFGGADALEPAVALIAGFDSITPLVDAELSVLRDLLRTRLATTMTMMHWRVAMRAETDEYLRKSLQDEGSAERFLRTLNAVSGRRFARRVERARRS